MKEKVVVILAILVMYAPQATAGGGDAIFIDADIQLVHLRDSVFVHVTWHDSKEFGRFPSNGLIVIKSGQALMVDTPMDNDKTERLIRYIRDTLSVELTRLVIGHFHDDCLGGLEYIQRIGVESVANEMTLDKCLELALPIPSISFKDSLQFDFNGEQIICRYFGPGHSSDNITVYLPGKNILFGGCLIRALVSKGLGNLSDAAVDEWDKTVKKVLETYPDSRIVVPGHGNSGGQELLTHTLELVERTCIK